MTYFCHACRRETHGSRLPNSNDLVCVICGTSGFVEEFDRSTFVRTEVSNAQRQAANARYIFDPFLLLSSMLRDYQRGGNMSGPEGGPFIFLPDAISQILTGENLDNIVTQIMSQQSGPCGPPPAAKSVLASLPRRVLSAAEANDAGECVVCQEDLKAGDTTMQLTENGDKCSHVFHQDCLLPWLKLHNSCPVCRYQLPTDDVSYERTREVVEQNLSRSLSSQRGAAPSGRGMRPIRRATTFVGGSIPRTVSHHHHHHQQRSPGTMMLHESDRLENSAPPSRSHTVRRETLVEVLPRSPQPYRGGVPESSRRENINRALSRQGPSSPETPMGLGDLFGNLMSTWRAAWSHQASGSNH